jgi:predicted Zn-dependent protease
MIEIHGQLYDGKTSARASAVCRVYDSGTVHLNRSDTGRRIASLAGIDDVRFSARLADTPRYLNFPGGVQFETEDNDAVDRLLKRYRKRSVFDFVHLLESKKRYVLAALAAMMLFIALFIRYGVPAAARTIAFHLPARASQIAAEQTLSALDKAAFHSSELDPKVREGLETHFQPLISAHPSLHLRVLFRKSDRIGPNAFALPDGTIVFTDKMVEMAKDDDELLAVLAHETGHVVHRHGMRRLIQDSLLAFALMAVTGDVSGTSELFYSMPIMLTELAYSRQFEREADQYALNYLKSHNIDTAHFARLMRRIDQWRQNRGGGRLPSYLSTHPATEKRLRRFDP